MKLWIKILTLIILKKLKVYKFLKLIILKKLCQLLNILKFSIYKESKPDEKNVLNASLGVSTIGSPERLKLVLIIIGALFRFSKFDKIS